MRAKWDFNFESRNLSNLGEDSVYESRGNFISSTYQRCGFRRKDLRKTP